MVGNRMIGLQVGLRDLGGRAAVTSFGDVIATAESLFGPAQTAIDAEQVNGLGGDLSVTNADLLDNIDPVVILSDSHLTLDSSIVTASILERGVSSCAITFSAGPTTGGDSCQTFQSDSLPSFFNPDNPSISDFHLIAVKDAPFIDHGNPAAPPDGASDIDGDSRAIDGDGMCPLNPIRDIGADEFNAGVTTCPPPPVTPPPPVVTSPPAGDGGGTASPGQTGKRATALKKCKRRHGAARRKCVRRARHLPV
jgi:hypothetical protein